MVDELCINLMLDRCITINIILQTIENGDTSNSPRLMSPYVALCRLPLAIFTPLRVLRIIQRNCVDYRQVAPPFVVIIYKDWFFIW